MCQTDSLTWPNVFKSIHWSIRDQKEHILIFQFNQQLKKSESVWLICPTDPLYVINSYPMQKHTTKHTY